MPAKNPEKAKIVKLKRHVTSQAETIIKLKAALRLLKLENADLRKTTEQSAIAESAITESTPCYNSDYYDPPLGCSRCNASEGFECRCAEIEEEQDAEDEYAQYADFEY